MDLILVNVGNSIPQYSFDSIVQARKYIESDIYYICSNVAYKRNKIAFRNQRLKHILIEDLNDEHIKEFEDIQYFEKNYRKYGNMQFWKYATERLFYLNCLITLQNMRNVLHFENDVLIYTDITKLSGFNSYEHIGMTQATDRWFTTGMMFINGPSSMTDMIKFFLSEFQKGDPKVLCKKYREEYNFEHLNFLSEMVLFFVFHKETNLISSLPSIPIGEQSVNLEQFDSIFDPASWGQYVGGNFRDRRPGINALYPSFIKDYLNSGKNKVTWKDKIPYVGKYRINNLHIHSKNLKKFMA